MDQSSRISGHLSTEENHDQQSHDPIFAVNLAEPETMMELMGLPRHPPRTEPTPKVRREAFNLMSIISIYH
jgi:hypothetical protein